MHTYIFYRLLLPRAPTNEKPKHFYFEQSLLVAVINLFIHYTFDRAVRIFYKVVFNYITAKTMLTVEMRSNTLTPRHYLNTGV